MYTFCLHIFNESYSAEEILLWNDSHPDVYTQKVLSYCKQWLKGEEHFELKTSGSTGAPKTIQIQRSQIIASAKATIHFFKLNAGDAVSCPLSVDVIGGQMMLYRSIIGNLNLYVIPPSKKLEQLDTQISYTFMPIAAVQLFETLTSQPEKIATLNKLTHLLVGGSALSTALVALIKNKLTCSVWQSYGMTETVSHIAMRCIHPTTDSAYTLLENSTIDIDNRSCLKVKGAVTNNVWLQTNDCIEQLNAKQFNILGRIDFTINSGGIKIQVEPIEIIIETLFSELNIQTSFFLGGIKDDALGEKLVLFINTIEMEITQIEFILSKLNNILPKYHAPKQIQLIPFKYTPSGKIDRKKTMEKVRL